MVRFTLNGRPDFFVDRKNDYRYSEIVEESPLRLINKAKIKGGYGYE